MKKVTKAKLEILAEMRVWQMKRLASALYSNQHDTAQILKGLRTFIERKVDELEKSEQ